MKLVTLLTCLTLGALQVSEILWATEYYVSNAGNDENSGLSEQVPWRTLQNIRNRSFKGDDQILFHRGDIWKGEALDNLRRQEGDGWVFIGAYGSGDKPRIWPGYDKMTAIGFGKVEQDNRGRWRIAADGQGRWQISDLDIGFAQAGIIFLNAGSRVSGFRILRCDIHNIHGANTFQYPFMHHSTGIVLFNQAEDSDKWLTDVEIKNIQIQYADAGTSFWGIRKLDVSDYESRYTGRSGGINLFKVMQGNLKNVKIEWAGIHGMFWGTAAFSVSRSIDVNISNIEIAFTQKPFGSPDGVGIDFEGSNRNIKLNQANIHHNQGSAILVYRNKDWGTDNENIVICDSVLTMNGLEDPLNIPAFIRYYDNEKCTGSIQGNKIQLTHPLQPWNLLDGKPTNSWPKSFESENNVVHFE